MSELRLTREQAAKIVGGMVKLDEKIRGDLGSVIWQSMFSDELGKATMVMDQVEGPDTPRPFRLTGYDKLYENALESAGIFFIERKIVLAAFGGDEKGLNAVVLNARGYGRMIGTITIGAKFSKTIQVCDCEPPQFYIET